jgi:hypothetical protein
MNDEKEAIDELVTTLMATNAGNFLAGIGLNGGTIAATTAQTPLPKLEQPVDDIMEQYSMNRFAVDHKVTAAELLKLQETAPDYAGEIKENIAKNLARDISKKVTFKKKFDKDTDVHHFIGRVWVFTDEELKAILETR